MQLGPGELCNSRCSGQCRTPKDFWCIVNQNLSNFIRSNMAAINKRQSNKHTSKQNNDTQMPHTRLTNTLHSGQTLSAVYKDHFLSYSIYVGISYFYIWQLTLLYQYQKSMGSLRQLSFLFKYKMLCQSRRTWKSGDLPVLNLCDKPTVVERKRSTRMSSK